MDPTTLELLQQLKAVADPVRLRLVALCRYGEVSVSELTGVVGLSQPRVSQQLKILCDAGLLERFRDGQRVYYRIGAAPAARGAAARRRALLGLVPDEDSRIRKDAAGLRQLRSRDLDRATADGGADRALYRALVDLTVTAPLGDLLDIGCGRGRLMKLLASRANRAVGVDIDAAARELARAELLLAGMPNCSLRAGDMYRLPFADCEFDTILLDDVLGAATRPVDALREARRLLRPGGRLVILQRTAPPRAAALQERLAAWCMAASLRLAPARLTPRPQSDWLLAVAEPAGGERRAA